MRAQLGLRGINVFLLVLLTHTFTYLHYLSRTETHRQKDRQEQFCRKVIAELK